MEHASNRVKWSPGKMYQCFDWLRNASRQKSPTKQWIDLDLIIKWTFLYQQPTLDNESFVVAISPMSPIIALPVYLAFMSVCQLLLMVLLSLKKKITRLMSWCLPYWIGLHFESKRIFSMQDYSVLWVIILLSMFTWNVIIWDSKHLRCQSTYCDGQVYIFSDDMNN